MKYNPISRWLVQMTYKIGIAIRCFWVKIITQDCVINSNKEFMSDLAKKLKSIDESTE